MPIHDWSRADAGVFCDLRVTWIGRVKAVLNERILPEPFYAIAEPVVGEAVPDVLTLQAEELPSSPAASARPALDDSRDATLARAPASVVVQDLEPADP